MDRFRKPALYFFFGLLLGSAATLPIKRLSHSYSGEECQQSWEAIVKIDFNQYGTFEDANEPNFRLSEPDILLSDLNLLAKDSCRPTNTDTPIAQRMLAFREACGSIDTGKVNKLSISVYYHNAPGYRCLQETLKYKFAATDALYSKTPIDEMHDSNVLMNLFYAEAIRVNRSSTHLGRILIRILSVDKRNLHAAKLLVKVAYTYWKGSRTSKGREVAARIFDSALMHARSLGPLDYQMTELSLKKTVLSGDIPGTRALAGEATRKGYPQLGGFYLAWSLYLEGKPEMAASNLQGVLTGRMGDYYLRAALALNRLRKDITELKP